MKRSGYEVTIKAFLPCDVHLRGSVSAADRTIDCFLATMNSPDYECFLAVTETRKYRQKAEVPDPATDPNFREVDEPAEAAPTGDGAALAAVGAQVTAGVAADNADPNAPAGLRRAGKAGG